MDGMPERGNVALVVIDVQEKFKASVHQMGRVMENASKLIRAFKVFGLPAVHTEQYPKGLGNTVPEVAKELEGKPVTKMEFSCMRNSDFMERLKSLGVRQLALCGLEAHVCVLKTALDAMREGYEVYLVEDATSSRRETDWKAAIARAGQAGAYIVSSEMLIFQLMERAGTEEFKKVQEIVK